jgi:hypothetical protein
MTVDQGWGQAARRNVVATGSLGIAAITGAPYKQREGKPYQLDSDYHGKKRPGNIPSPGPYALTGKKEIRVNVWPKKRPKSYEKARSAATGYTLL